MLKLSALSVLTTLAVATTGLAVTQTASAGDSARIQWDTNGHYYQRFEGSPITWPDAKTACEAKSAHLVTITSEEEQGFIYTNFLNGQGDHNWYHIGGTSTDTYVWTWTTGESFKGYTKWDTDGAPFHNTDQNYLGIAVSYAPEQGYSSWYSGHYGQWFNSKADWLATGYLCEWSTQNYIDSALVPDMDNNGVDEVAVLYVDFQTGQHTVKIKDPSSNKLLSTLVFNKSFTPPSGLIVLKDSTKNGVPEIGVLFSKYKYPNVWIKDAQTNKTVSQISFLLPNYKPNSVAVGPDVDGNGAEEIVVTGVNTKTGAAKAEVRDSKTGNVSNSTNF